MEVKTVINSVHIINNNRQVYDIELFHPEKSELLVEKIDGIGPVKTSINESSGALTPGAFFNSSKINTRNLVIDLIFYPEKHSIEEVRLKTYEIFKVDSPIEIRINTDKHQVRAFGYVESNEPDIFSEQEGCSISIICLDPYWYELTDEVFPMSDIDPKFSFWFKNPDPPAVEDYEYDPSVEKVDWAFSTEALGEYTSENFPAMLMMGEVNTNPMKNLYNKGNADKIGTSISVSISGDVSNFVFGNQTTGETFTIDDSVVISITGHALQADDTLIISSVRGNKFVKLQRGINEYNLLPAKTVNSEWITLNGGNNIVWYYCDGIEDTEVNVTFTPAYLGV